MLQQKKLMAGIPYFVITLLALYIFQLKLGWRALNPTCYEWLLLGGDSATELLSWEFYRRTAWHFPIIGSLEGYCYPTVMGVGLTGTVPLFGIPIKALVSVERYPFFQILGWWILLCYIFQGIFAIRLLRNLNINTWWELSLGACLFVLTPALLLRTGHVHMVGHWLILWALGNYFQNVSGTKMLRNNLLVIGAVSLVHQYMLLMILGITFGSYLKLWRDGKTKWWNIPLYTGYGLALVVFIWYIIGNFNIPLDANITTGFGHYSSNLNTLFNPNNSSAGWIPSLPYATTGQYEGIGYLGAGVLLLWGIGILTTLFQPISLTHLLSNNNLSSDTYKSRFSPLLVVTLLLSLFALSNVVTFNDKILFTIPVNGGVLASFCSTFRSSGRFIWVLVYICEIGGLLLLLRQSWRKEIKQFILLSAVILQFVDTKPMFSAEGYATGQYPPRINLTAWQNLTKGANRLVTYPTYEQNIINGGDFYDFSLVAVKNNQSITTGYFGRHDIAKQAAYTQALDAKLEQGSLQGEERSIFIINPNFAYNFNKYIEKGIAKAFSFQGYTLVIPNTLPEVQKQAESTEGLTLTNISQQRPDEFIQKYAKDNWVAITIRDDAANKLAQESRDFFTANNSQLKDIAFRDSYIGLWRAGKPVFEQLDKTKDIRKTFAVGDMGLPKSIELYSAGANSGLLDNTILIDGQRVDTQKRGMNMVVFDNTGKQLISTYFDTYSSCCNQEQ